MQPGYKANGFRNVPAARVSGRGDVQGLYLHTALGWPVLPGNLTPTLRGNELRLFTTSVVSIPLLTRSRLYGAEINFSFRLKFQRQVKLQS